MPAAVRHVIRSDMAAMKVMEVPAIAAAPAQLGRPGPLATEAQPQEPLQHAEHGQKR